MSAGVSVTTTGQGVGAAMAIYESNTATDTFTGGAGADFHIGCAVNILMGGDVRCDVSAVAPR